MRKSKKSSIIVLLIAAVILLGSYGVWRIGSMQEKEMTLLNINEIQNSFYKNPVGNITDIGDPFVLKAADGKYYCYPTSWNMGFKAWQSDDMVNWYDLGPVYKGYTSWAGSDYWAPEVVEYEGRYYMYYTGRWTKNKSLRIGVAVSDSPKGPFVDVFDHPMFDFGYAAIDANIFIDDDGKKYMYFSRDCSENRVSARNESHIYGIELNDDMITVKGEPILLTKPEQEWEKFSGNEWRWNEGAVVFKRNGIYYLMYSANCYASKLYSIGYATSDSPLGTYAKYEKNPIVEAEITWDHVSGPGHNSITASPDGSEWFIVYHTHTDPVHGGGSRQVFIDRMGFRQDGSIYVNGPTLTEQPMPSGVTEYINIASEAQITVDSQKADFAKEALNDGEIGLYSKNYEYEWVSDSSKENTWIKLEWNEKRKISSVLVYGSVLKDRRIRSCRLIFSNNQIITKLNFPEMPGVAAIASFPELEAEWVKIEIDKAEIEGTEIGLSEIFVLGKK